MPSDLTLKTMNAVHRTLMRLSFGRLGWTGMDMPVLELTTTGRKSGRPHAVMLTAPARDGDNYVIVASRGGDDIHPAWFLNLRDHPDVLVSLKGRPKVPMRARITTGDERKRLWDKVIRDHDLYAGYQKRTTREIPIVLLEPRR